MRGKYKERTKNLLKNQGNQSPPPSTIQSSINKLTTNKISIQQNNITQKQNENIIKKEKSKQNIISSKEISKAGKQYSSQNYKSTYLTSNNDTYFYSNLKQNQPEKKNNNYITNYSTKISNKNNNNNVNEKNEKLKNNNTGYMNAQTQNLKNQNLKMYANSFKHFANVKSKTNILEQSKINNNNEYYSNVTTSENIIRNNNKINNSRTESENSKSFNFSRNNPLKSNSKINYSNDNNNFIKNNQNIDIKPFKQSSKRKFYKDSKMNQIQTQTINNNPSIKYYLSSVNKSVGNDDDHFNNLRSVNSCYEENNNSVENFPKIKEMKIVNKDKFLKKDNIVMSPSNKNINNIQNENYKNYNYYQYPQINLKNNNYGNYENYNNNNNYSNDVNIREIKKSKNNNILYRNTSDINPSDNSSPVHNNENNKIKYTRQSPNPILSKPSYVKYFDYKYTNSINPNITNNFNINNYNINNYNKNQITKQYFGNQNIYSKEEKLHSPNTRKLNEIDIVDNNQYMIPNNKKIYFNNNDITNQPSKSPRIYKKKFCANNDNRIEKSNKNYSNIDNFKLKSAKNTKCIYQNNLMNTEQRYKDITNTQRDDNKSLEEIDDLNLLNQNNCTNCQQSLNNTNNDGDKIIYQQKSKTYIRKKHNTYVLQKKNKEYSSNKEDTTTSNNYDDALSKNYIYQNDDCINYNIDNPMIISEIKNKNHCFVEKYYKYALKNEYINICIFTKANISHKTKLPLNKISYFTKTNIIKKVNKFSKKKYNDNNSKNNAFYYYNSCNSREIGTTEDNFTFCEDDILSNKKAENTIEHDFNEMSDIHSLANDSIMKMFSNNTNTNNNPVINDVTLGRIPNENSILTDTKKGDNLSDKKMKESSFAVGNIEGNENEDFKIMLSDDDNNSNSDINKEINNTISDSGYSTPKLFEKNNNENNNKKNNNNNNKNNNRMINKFVNKLTENNTKKSLEIFTGKLENIFNKYDNNKDPIRTTKTIYKNISFNSRLNNDSDNQNENQNDNNDIANKECENDVKYPVKYKEKCKTYVPKKSLKGKYYEILSNNDLTPLNKLEKKMSQLLNISNKKNNIKQYEVDFIFSLENNIFTSFKNLLSVNVLEHIRNMNNSEINYVKKEKNYLNKENNEIKNNKNIEDIGRWGRKDMTNEIKQAEKYIEQLHLKMSKNKYKYEVINILNILTLDNFYVILEQLNNFIISDNASNNEIKEKEKVFVEVTIDKAILESKFSILYAKLCLELNNLINNDEIINFMNIVIEKRFNNLNDISIQNISNKDEEYFIIKKKFLGTVNLIADLIKLKIKTILYGFNCVNILLNKYYLLLNENDFNLRYLNLEAVINFFSKFGKIIFETNNNNYIEKLNNYINKKLFLIIDDTNVKKDCKIPGYLKYKIINLIQKLKNNWEDSLYEKSIQIKGKNNNDLLLFSKNTNKNTKIGKLRSKSMYNKNTLDLNFSFIKIFKDENLTINYSFNIPKKNKINFLDNNDKLKDEENYLISVKNDLNNFTNYLMDNNIIQNEKLSSEKIDKITDEYDWTIIDNFINIDKINLADIINYFLETCIDFIDKESKLFFSNEYIKNIISYYLPFVLSKEEFNSKILKIFLNVKELVIDNMLMYNVMGHILFLLLNNNAIEIKDFNVFKEKEDEIIIIFAKIIKNCVIFFKGEEQKNYFVKFRDLELFSKNSNIFYNNVSRPLRALLI